MSEIKLRKATLKDSPDVLCWRNDPVAVAVSFNKKLVDKLEHKQWFAKVLKDKRRRLFIAVSKSGEKIGVIRFDLINNKFAEVSINLEPSMRGKGYGAKIIDLGTRKMKGINLLARTKESSSASIRVFEKAGYSRLFDYIDKTQDFVQVLGKASR